MRAWLLASAAAAVMTVGLIALIHVTRSTPAAGVAAGPVRCARPAARPAEARGSTALALLGPGAVAVTVDGATAAGTVRLAPGAHVVAARGERGTALTLELTVDAFSPAVVQLLEDPGGLLPVVAGARCTSCAAGLVALPDMSPDGGPFDLDESARAVADGDVRRALAILARTPLSSRGGGRVARQLAAAWTLAGHPSLAPRAVVAPVEGRRAAMEKSEAAEEAAHWLASWNTLTERFRALSDEAAPHAPAIISPASVRLDELSRRFVLAVEAGDVVAQGEVYGAAAALLARTVDELAALRPGDCAWQARLDPWR